TRIHTGQHIGVVSPGPWNAGDNYAYRIILFEINLALLASGPQFGKLRRPSALRRGTGLLRSADYCNRKRHANGPALLNLFINAPLALCLELFECERFFVSEWHSRVPLWSPGLIHGGARRARAAFVLYVFARYRPIRCPRSSRLTSA